MTNDIIAIIANLALALSFIVGLIFGIVQVKAAARDRKERLTVEALRNFQSHEFIELAFNINSFNAPPTHEEWRKLPANDQIMLFQYTQVMESLGILVADRFINIDLIDKTLGSLVITTWDKLKSGIFDMREKQPDPFLCEYFQWLAEGLDENMKMYPRKPFYEINNKEKRNAVRPM